MKPLTRLSAPHLVVLELVRLQHLMNFMQNILVCTKKDTTVRKVEHNSVLSALCHK